MENVLCIYVGIHIRLLFHHGTADRTVKPSSTMGKDENRVEKSCGWLTFQSAHNRHVSTCRRGGCKCYRTTRHGKQHVWPHLIGVGRVLRVISRWTASGTGENRYQYAQG